MAKKKKQTSRKKKAEVIDAPLERSPFWAITGAILLLIAALFLLLGGFGTGGDLPVGMFSGAYAVLGWAAYLTPVALAYWGIHKFVSEDRKIPLHKFSAMLAVLVLAASWLFTAFASQQADGSYAGGHGGWLGGMVGGAVLQALDKIPASILFFIFTLLAIFYSFGITHTVASFIINLVKGKDKEDTDLNDLKAQAADNGFKLNEAVPVERPGGKQNNDPKRLSSLKNSANKLTPAENHEALTTASDPDWKFPGIDLLNQKVDKANAGDVEGNAKLIEETFDNFGIKVEMEGATVGPTVTQYTLKPPSDVKLTKVSALENNLALNLAAHSLRMETPIPGKRAVGIEVPNVKPAIVRLSSLFQSDIWQRNKNSLCFALGKDINGTAIMADLVDMPHLLIAGQTKSGKSVMINTLLTSLVYRNSPSDMKLILVDPKVVELAPYNKIPHLLAPVITEPEKCISALKWSVAEMERRYRALADEGTRNIEEYNEIKKEAGMPYIVIVIDELADMMMMAARDVEALIVRLAQKARAVGIHLVLATQSPRADVITGLIKANVPSRIAFAVSGQIESRIILDSMGAEKLLGKGDMLYKSTDMPRAKRIQGAFISTEETKKVTDFLRNQREPQYDDEIISQPVQIGKGSNVVDMGGGSDADDDMWRDAVHVVIESRKASTALLQRKLRIGYGRAARIVDTMEERGIIGPADGARGREVLVSSMDDVFGEPASEMPDEASENA